MKVNLIRSQNDSLNGYENIITNNFLNLSLCDMVDDAEATEFRAIDILPFFPAHQSEMILDLWVKKLAHDGKIIIGFLEILEVAKGIVNYAIDIDEANIYLYGQKDDTDLKKTCFTVKQISNYLESKGLKITKKIVEDYKCVVEAQRL